MDVWWTVDGELRSNCEFAPHPPAETFAKRQKEFVSTMMSCPIATLSAPISSKRVRFEESGVATMLLQFLKRGLHRDGVEVAMIQGGAIRANSDYVAGPFTLGDLYREMAFPTHQAVIWVPGHVIADSVANTRSAPKPAPNFLHLDADCVVAADGHQLTHINGAPIEPEREYCVAIYLALLNGLNVIEPLLSWVQAHGKVPSIEGCRPGKEIVLETAMKDAWRRLIGFDKWDCAAHGRMGSDELCDGLIKVLAEIDRNGDGQIDPDELDAYLYKKHGHHDAALISQMVKTVDTNHDGKVSAAELAELAH